nr:hypothetical protein [Candidatus Njordarchaeota archaeon]
MEITKGFSEGSLKPFRKDEEKASKIDDKKRWLDYLKKMEES